MQLEEKVKRRAYIHKVAGRGTSGCGRSWAQFTAWDMVSHI